MNVKVKQITTKCKNRVNKIIILSLELSKIVDSYFCGFSSSEKVTKLRKNLCEYSPTMKTFNFVDFNQWGTNILEQLAEIRVKYDQECADPEQSSKMEMALKELNSKEQQRAYRLHVKINKTVELFIEDFEELSSLQNKLE